MASNRLAVILSVGSELTSGAVVDTNGPFLAAELREWGIATRAILQIGDDEGPLAREVARVAVDGTLVLITGGLGPTKDDVTRAAVAKALEKRLIEDAASLRAIEERFQRRGIPMTSSNRLQALVPEGATVIPNDHGTAPGFLVAADNFTLAALPGVPREMTAMWREQLKPILRRMFVGSGILLTHSLRCFGAPESAVDERLTDLLDQTANPRLGLLAGSGVITVKITASARSTPEAEAMIASTAAVVRERLGNLLFGEGSEDLEHAVARLLEQRPATVAVAESCTGGMLSSFLTNVPGISRFFREGVVTYANAAKTRLLGVSESLLAAHGAVSAEVAAAMAEGVRRNAGTDYALAVTGIAGPDGGSAEKPVGLVFIALASPAGTDVHRHQFLGERNFVRRHAARTALNHLRLKLLERD